MTKELKIELFNIYDVVIFEDENGITQDCVCSIGKGRVANEMVDEIECNNHDISIYENGSYKVWEKNGKNLPYYLTNKKIIHLYTLKNDNRFYEIYPTDDYSVIEKANHSEITLRELVSKCIINHNSIVDVFEQDKNNSRYSNKIFHGMAWEMEKQDIGNRKLKYIFSAVAETISENDRVCIEVEEDE